MTDSAYKGTAGEHVTNENAKIASKRSTNIDQLSSWSCVSITSMAFPAKTTVLEH